MRTPVLIIGAGIGGVAAARELARRGVSGLTLLEQGPLAGAHASGRNAALILTNVTDETGVTLAREGAAFYRNPPADLPFPIPFRRCGSLLLASGPEGAERLERDTAAARARGLDVELLNAEDAAKKVPVLEARDYVGAAFTADDGVLDIHSLMRSFLADAEARGVTRIHGRRVRGIRVEAGAVTGVETDAGFLEAGTVVNAAGPWAGALAAEVGAPLPLRPTRRHIVITQPIDLVDPAWPYAWDIDRPFYFRPDSGGLLLCACDVTDAPDLDETPRAEWIGTTLAEARRRIPRAGDIEACWTWAGLRTLTPDGRFVIGFDDRAAGLFHVAGLGGHGITCAPTIGRIAADLMLEGKTGVVDAARLSPARFR